ncbi:MAG: Asp-tRNA(Asn)/Glu-tRNA(Gln) amidotransferase subunit GatC [Tissierellia bacterium]|nr:Asp-tRNA(Asn)/Glu-tRNA(Gln) amidotransferase subunit GatC [Tissierellia bacterium]MDD4725480.1 Asp-tRNA(Asn)/Glu-tRNA(Gln) amidotransferase subunit GatC [Tissierellia bacterium]
MITKDEVLHITDIAKLKISDEEISPFIEKFDKIIEFVEKIKVVDTENVEPLYQVNEDNYLLKDDEEDQILNREEALQNTKEQKYGYFKILKVVE